jgi:hypothetical protein
MRAAPRAFGLVLLSGMLAVPLSAQAEPENRAGVASALSVASVLHHTSLWPESGAPQARLAGEASLEFQTTTRNRRKGALWGAGVGFVAGGLLAGLSVGSEEDDGFGESIAESALTAEAVVFGAAVGAGLGALLGATVFAPHRLTPAAEAAGIAIRIEPRRDGDGRSLGLGLQWRR